MKRGYIALTVRRVVASAVAGFFFWLSTRQDFYNATTPYSMSSTLFGNDVPHIVHPWWLSLHILVRKSLSIVAFAIVGFCAHHALGATARPRLRAAAIVAAYSLAIEIAQHTVDPDEPMGERVLDIACGAAGGWLAIVIDDRLRRVRRRMARRV